MLKFPIFQENWHFKELVTETTRLGFNTSLPTENMCSTAAENGREVLYFIKS